MLQVFVWGILTFVAAVNCEKQRVDVSNILSRIILNPQRNVESSSLEASPEIDSSEHGVTPGKSQTSCPCGKANRGQARIIGGRQIKPSEYPFLAALSYTRNQKTLKPHCGSTIISDRHLLTAAHCTKHVGGSKGLAVTVALDELGNVPTSNTVEVERLIQHENYDPKWLKNDISLLYLKTSLQWTEAVSPVCMPLPGMSVIGKYVIVIGWGATEFLGPMTLRPQKVDVLVITTEECYEYWAPYVYTDPVTQICTMSQNRATCEGDSGSPVVWLDPDTNRYTIVGLVSSGGACDDSSPGIHTSVVSYLPWISEGIEATTPGRKLCYKIEN
uniref:Putative salivary serine protease n=1 Tax=Panstrongylus lignarius TaxID=156445 RepID=A0A224XS85_9HEMI